MISESDGGCYLVSEICPRYSRWLTAKLVVSIEPFRNFRRRRQLRRKIPALSVAYDAMLRPMGSGGASDIILE